MSMEYRELGKSGLKISVIGVGTWAMGGWQWGGTDDEKTSDGLARSLEIGVNFIDTAAVYGFGHSEEVLGKALKARRNDYILATKFGLVWTEPTTASVHNDISPASIERECEASLKRLQTDHIDLYQAHWPLPGEAMTKTVAEEMMAALIKLRTAGKIRHIGVSNFTVEQMEWCGGSKDLVSLQPPLSIMRPGRAQDVIPYCHKENIGVVCYSPMFRGLLTGKYKGDETFAEGDTRGAHKDYQGERFKAICGAVQKLGVYAERHKTTIAGVSLNWVLQVPGVTCAIAGMRDRTQIEQAARGAGWNLTPEEACEISGLFKDYITIF